MSYEDIKKKYGEAKDMLENELSRSKNFFLDHATLMSILEGKSKIVGLPDDAVILGVRESFERRSLMIGIWSQEFEIVSQSCMFPEAIVEIEMI